MWPKIVRWAIDPGVVVGQENKGGWGPDFTLCKISHKDS